MKEKSEKADFKFNIQRTKIMVSGPITSWQIDGETKKTVTDFIFLGSKITADGDCTQEIQRYLLLERKAMANLGSVLKSRNISFPTEGRSQSYNFSSIHVWIWQLNHKDSWTQKNWCFWTVVLEKTFKSPLHYKEIKPVNAKGNQSWIFIGRTDVGAEIPILWPPDRKNWLIWKDPDARKDWRQMEKGVTEDEMVACHYWLNGYAFKQALGVGDGLGSLVCCSSRDREGSDMTKQLDWTALSHFVLHLFLSSFFFFFNRYFSSIINSSEN